MTASPKVLKITLDPCPREKCVDIDRKGCTGRKKLRHSPSSNMRGSKRPNIWKDLDEKIERITLSYDLYMHQME
jgi:hypothetical protein